MSVIPIEREISRLQKVVDTYEWEGLDAKDLKRELEALRQQQLNGELYYVNF